jgi:hypothetical protein
MTLTRDALAFSWLAVIAAVLSYLALGDPPSMWTWQQWMQNIVAIIGIVGGKLGTSPLPGRTEVDDAVDLLKLERPNR